MTWPATIEGMSVEMPCSSGSSQFRYNLTLSRSLDDSHIFTKLKVCVCVCVRTYFINFKTEFIRITFIILAKLTVHISSINVVEITVGSHGTYIVILFSFP